MKIEEKYLENNSEISKWDFYQYNLFTATISIRKPINIFFYSVITLVFGLFIVLFAIDAVKAIEENNNLLLFKNLALSFIATLVVILNIYVYLKISSIVLYLSRISMCLTCATFPFIIENFTNNTAFMILFFVVSAFCILSLFTTKIFADKTYQRLGKLNYNFVFKPKQMEVVSATASNSSKSNFEYEKIMKIYEVGNFYYCYVNRFEALIIKKNSFINGEGEDFLRILFKNNRSAKLINW